MTSFRRVAVVVVVLLLLAFAVAAWYLLGSNGRPAAILVPGDTLAFAVIPNGVTLGTGYESSKLKQLINAPEAQPLLDSLEKVVGDKNLALLKLLAPELSGQSFFALTHFDPAHPGETGFVAGLRPKLGTDHFDEFVQQVNAAYPDLAKETKTGHDTLMGVDYQWIEGAQARGRICVARYKGWIVTTWGEASLQDFLERMQGKSSTPSLAENPDFQKSRDRVGAGAQAVAYINYGQAIGLITQHFTTTNPALAAQLKKRLAGVGGAAVGTSFDGGEIVDRFSILESRQTQLDSGMSAAPCPFDTLKFTGPDTRLYLAASLNWPQVWKNLQEQFSAASPLPAASPSLPAPPSPAFPMIDQLTSAAQSVGLDLHKNVIDALGQEYSVQVEWPNDAAWPDLAIYLKVDKPDDFKPTIAALIDQTRKAFAASAVITEMESNGRHFATLKMISPMPVSPTITEDGPYFGFFLNETHAVRSFARDESRGLLHNDDFNRQIGSPRDGASQIIFVDTPKLVDQTYRAALPWVNMGAMLNQKLATLLQGKKLPPDLAWLAPMGTWSAVARSDDAGVTGFSTSGAGNQGIIATGVLLAGTMELQQAGLLPQKQTVTPAPGSPVVLAPLPSAPGTTTAPAPASPLTSPAPPAPSAPPVSSDATTPPASTH